MLAVVVTDVEIESEYQFERRMFSSNPEQLRSLAAWLVEQEAEEVVMVVDGAILEAGLGNTGTVLEADTPEAGKALARHRELCISRTRYPIGGGGGARRIFWTPNAWAKWLVARELNLSFVPNAEQRLWRTVVRRKLQLTRNRVRLQNRVESLLEEAHIKLSSFVSDLLG